MEYRFATVTHHHNYILTHYAIPCLSNSDQERADQLQEANRNMEKLLNKRSLALTKREDNMRKIRDLGTVPHAELDRFVCVCVCVCVCVRVCVCCVCAMCVLSVCVLCVCLV